MRRVMHVVPAVLLLSSIASLLLARRGETVPLFAARQGLMCGTCHFDPNGGGPRNEFGFAVSQGGNMVSLDIPALDPGWAKSKPAKGKYVWKGSIGGFMRVKVIDKTFAKGWIRVQVKGRFVPGASAIDTGSPYLVQSFFDLACNLTNPPL